MLNIFAVSENDKKPIFTPDFGLFSPNLSPQDIFRRFYLY